MADVYAVGGDDCFETTHVFSTLDKAMAAVEARILKWHLAGHFGRDLEHGPAPTITWDFEQWEGGDGWSFRARFNATYTWCSGRRAIYTIPLDRAELP